LKVFHIPLQARLRAENLKLRRGLKVGKKFKRKKSNFFFLKLRRGLKVQIIQSKFLKELA